jgi:hypothetical protein
LVVAAAAAYRMVEQVAQEEVVVDKGQVLEQE